MSSDRKYEPIKESRGWYFVEYRPPMSGEKYATLALVIIKDTTKTEIVTAMENELQSWLNRYPLPLLVSAFDDKGDLYHLEEIKQCNLLIGFFDQHRRVKLHWKLLRDDEIPDVALNQEYVDNLYSDLVFKTYAELDLDKRKRRRQIQLGWFIFFIWLVIVPLIIAILDFSSEWISLVALIYSFYKAVQKCLELTGISLNTKSRKEKEVEEQLKNHYYYHCQMNPEGFRRLRQENFEKMANHDIAKEAESIKMGQHKIVS